MLADVENRGKGMAWLVVGVLLWSFAHLFGRLAPDARAAMGKAGKGGIALLVLASLVLMTVGYRDASGAVFWVRSPAMVGINNLLMLLALYLMVAATTRAWVTGVIRHPQLTAMKSWAVAHLLVNGDTPSLVLFGGLLAWAVVSVILINKSEPNPARVVTTSAGREVSTGLVTIIAYGAVSFLHISLGYPVFG